jgi:hypothetical protein
MKKTLLTLSINFIVLSGFAQWNQNGGNISTSNNVGIGTTTPQYKLDVNGDVRTNNIVLPNGYQISRQLSDNFQYQSKTLGHYAFGWFGDSWYTSAGTLWQSGYGGIKFFTQGKFRMAIHNNGNVGVGTEAPQYKLDVNGKFYLRAVDKALDGWTNSYFYHQGHNLIIGSPAGQHTHNSLELKPTGTDKGLLYSKMTMFVTPKTEEYVPKVQIHTYGSSFFNGGNVGIGTESPQYKLDVNGNLRLAIPSSASPIQGLDISIASFKTPENAKNSYYLRMSDIGANAQDVFVVKGNRNVGIGFSEPQHKLDVNGNIRANNIILSNGYQITRNLSDNFQYQDKTLGHYAFGWFGDSWYTSAGTLWQSGFGGIKFFTQGKFRMAIHNNGNVGIGTDNPKNLLDVNGTIRAKEVKVELENWSDFVFDKDYKLPSLQEVETHINEHKHLPDIPSEKQVKEEGVNLAEMQAKLLQKIEELTLYVIKQEKKIEEQNKQIEKLEHILINKK